MSDGIITDDELQVLSQIAAFLKISVPQFVQKHVAAQGIALLRGLFADATSTGVLSQKTWNNLAQSAQRLGLTESQLKTAATPLARSFAEHVLADTKSDGLLTGEEEEYLRWLLQTFGFDIEFQTYVNEELRILKERTQIASGNLKTIATPAGINLHAGELLYLHRESILRLPKRLKSGPQHEDHVGRLLLTDNRLLFESSTKTVRIPYRSIIAWNATGDQIRVSVANKPELTFYFPPNAEPLLAEKFTTLIQLHSQILRKKVDGAVDRHIPRDIRQRVWQRFGGKCAECNATEYLEFDHIVPVAKGGSNSDQNVQLLCRRCNLVKSDKI